MSASLSSRGFPWLAFGICPATLATCVVLLFASPASAHGTIAAGDFYSGMLHPLLHVESVLAILALGLWLGHQNEGVALRIAGAFVAATGLGAALALGQIDLTQTAPLVPLSMILFGIAVASRGRIPLVVALVPAVFFGIAQGYSYADGLAGKLKAPAGYIFGMMLSAALALFYAALPVRRYTPFWFQVAVRIAGSWIAAIGLLVFAFRYRS